jgi:hypothetical protein
MPARYTGTARCPRVELFDDRFGFGRYVIPIVREEVAKRDKKIQGAA